MSLVNGFETSMKRVFEGRVGAATPIPLKKLARAVSKEMKRETLIIDGKDTAPSLYTILVSPQDVRSIQSFYAPMTDELVDYVIKSAHKKRLELLDDPVVRFIPNSKIKPGRFMVIAENVTLDALDDLRAEEDQFAGRNLNQAGLRFASPRAVARAENTQAPFVTSPDLFGGYMNEWDEFFSGARVVEVETGTSHNLGEHSTVIGRNARESDIAIRDSNISRRHCRIDHSGNAWTITDLKSTNGTFVNGAQVTTRALMDGDLITVGTVDLKFRCD